MKARRVCLTGMLCVWLWHAGEAKNCPSGAIAWVESVSASATRVKTGAENKAGCEDPPCVTQRYKKMREVTVKHYEMIGGSKRIDYSRTQVSTASAVAVPLGGLWTWEDSFTGHYSAYFEDGGDVPECPDTAFTTAEPPSYCDAYYEVMSYQPTADLEDQETDPCPDSTRSEAVDPFSPWLGSFSTSTTTYEDPITDAMLKGEVEKAIPEPSSGGPWGGGASSSYSLQIHQNQLGIFVKGTGSKCLYRFKVAGTESGTQYEILWDVWEQDPDGLRLFKSEKTSFTGTGKKFQYVAGRTLDVPGWDSQDCELGGGVRFIKMESIRVEIHEEDSGDGEE